MTLFKPTLQLKRLTVFRGAQIAYSEPFHPGVNIVRGKNSSGKTTIIDFVAYSLGAENIAWKPEALLCTDVVAEVELNGKFLTLRRPVNDKMLNPMYIFWGPMDEGMKAPFSAWEMYPFKRSSQKESFSQILFRAMEIAEVRGDSDSNITMHQILRLLYVDQRSAHSALFRTESFDSNLIRETVGNYLCGIYDDDLYEAQLRSRAIQEKLNKVSADLKSIFTVLGKSGQETNIEWVGSHIQSLRSEELTVSSQLLELKTKREAEVVKQKDPGVKNIRASLSEAKRNLTAAEDRKLELSLEIEDSNLFIRELDRRLSSLEESKVARAYLGSTNFSICPCCLSKIEKAKNGNDCELCKSPLDTRNAESQLLRMKNEMELQRAESIRLMDGRVVELADLDREIPSLKSTLKSLEKEYARASSTWNSGLETAIENAAKRLGEIEKEISQLIESQKLGNVILDLQKEKSILVTELSDVNTNIEKYKFAQESRKAEAKLAISNELINLLHLDMPREKEFTNAQKIEWEFGDNHVAVNDKLNFSESSMVILRHSFHLALLLASAKNKYFRIPRFLILDGIEDGGLELTRSYHLQRLVIQMSQNLKTEHQIILGTSQIDPTLEHEDYVVGRAFTPDEKSLAIKS